MTESGPGNHRWPHRCFPTAEFSIRNLNWCLRAPREASAVADQYALALQANPAAVGKTGERLVDRLA